jgi:opacity protein-like surface antigen
MLRKLLSIILSITLSIIFCFSSTFAKSDKLNPSNWFVEGRYQKSLNEYPKFKDNETDSTKIITVFNENWDDLDSYGFGFGYDFKKIKSSLMLGYEFFGTSNYSSKSSITQAGATNGPLKIPMKMNNIMIEFNRKYYINDNQFLIGILGLGQSTIESQKYSAYAYNRWYHNLGGSIKKNNTSTRFGLGVGAKINEKLKIIGIIQHSDYGSMVVNDTQGTTIESKTIATEASIRLRLSF